MPRISHILIEDHRRLEDLFRRLDSLTSTEEKQQWTQEMASEIARHCVCESLLLQDAIKEHIDNGGNFWRRYERDHTSVCASPARKFSLSSI
jgi:hypothetical protein